MHAMWLKAEMFACSRKDRSLNRKKEKEREKNKDRNV